MAMPESCKYLSTSTFTPKFDYSRPIQESDNSKGPVTIWNEPNRSTELSQGKKWLLSQQLDMDQDPKPTGLRNWLLVSIQKNRCQKWIVTMQNKNKYLSCSKCIRTALDIQSGDLKIDWEELGNSKPQCKECLAELKSQLYPETHQNSS